MEDIIMIVLQIIGVGIVLIALYMSYLYLKRNVASIFAQQLFVIEHNLTMVTSQYGRNILLVK